MNDGHTSALASTQESVHSPSRFTQFVSALCPCFNLGALKQTNNNSNFHQETKTNIHTYLSPKDNHALNLKKQTEPTLETMAFQPIKQKFKKAPLFNSLHQPSHKVDEQQNVSKSTAKIWHSYPVCLCRQDKLFIIGRKNYKMLAKISMVRIQPKEQAKILTQKSKYYEKTKHSYTHTNMDKYWNKRYFLFQKFDEGISMSQQSWPIAIPQAMSEYVASKIKCEKVLNLFSGTGGDAIKLANTCNKVIATDMSQNNLKSIYFNSKIYSVQNIQIKKQTEVKLQIEPDVIIVSNYNRVQEDCLSHRQVLSSDFKPSLKVVVNKVLKYAKNLVMILPANINIEELGKILAQQLINQNIIIQTCCLKIDKIFFASKLSYMVVYLGTKVTDVTINQQLQFIYGLLNEEPKKIFPHKKLIKKLRQMYGMVKLLNFVLQASQLKQGSHFQKLCHIIKTKNLLSEQKFKKIYENKRSEVEKNHIVGKDILSEGQQNIKQLQQQNQIERTISYFSSNPSAPSGIHRVSTDFKQLQTQNDPYKSVVLRTKARSSMLKSFGTPNKVYEIKNQKDDEEPKRQNSDVVEFFKLIEK